MSTLLVTADLTRFARAALLRYFAIEEAQGPKATQIAAAEFKGMCVAADRLGIAHTPDHMHMMVLDSVREAGERPAFRFAGNAARKNWDDLVTAAIVDRIENGEIR